MKGLQNSSLATDRNFQTVFIFSQPGASDQFFLTMLKYMLDDRPRHADFLAQSSAQELYPVIQVFLSVSSNIIKKFLICSSSSPEGNAAIDLHSASNQYLILVHLFIPSTHPLALCPQLWVLIMFMNITTIFLYRFFISVKISLVLIPSISLHNREVWNVKQHLTSPFFTVSDICLVLL